MKATHYFPSHRRVVDSIKLIWKQMSNQQKLALGELETSQKLSRLEAQHTKRQM